MGECSHKHVLKMKVVFIGAGKLAKNLSRALLGAGHDIIQVFSRTQASADEVAAVAGGASTTDIGRISSDADVYIISVSDSAMADLIPQVCKGREQKVFVHTAGSMPMNVFEGMALHYGVLYPMQTFSKERPVDFRDIPCFTEANDGFAAGVIEELATSVSSNVRQLSSDYRRYLHLAAVFACNFANHCYAISADILERHGIPFDVMLPLIDETARKVHQMPPAAAQTGPAVRYDENVIRSQSRMLRDNPIVKEIYERMSMSIHRKMMRG